MVKCADEEIGNVNVVLAREISKKYETIYRDRVSNLIDLSYKGEIVLIIEGVDNSESVSLEQLINIELENGNSGKRLVKAIALKSDYSKNEIYQKYLEMSKE